MRVLIAGGSGLIGRELTSELLKEGYEVIVLSRSTQPAGGNVGGEQVVRWDAKTTQGWGHLVDGADVVINLSGENIAGEGFFPARWTEDRKRRILSSRLWAGKAIAQAVDGASEKPGVLIQSSAIGYYGPAGDELLDEESHMGTDFMASVCRDWEESTQSVEKWGVRRIIIRTGVVLSNKGGAFTRLALPFRLFAGGPMGSGQQYLSWIHIRDEVRAIRYLLELPSAEGVYNLTAPMPITNAGFSKVLGRVMKRPSFLPVPGFVLRLIFGQVATVVLDGQRVLPKRLLEAGYTFAFTQAEQAVRDLLGK